MSSTPEGLIETDPGEHVMVPPEPTTARPPHGKVGMLFFLLTEACFFMTLIMTYIFYIGKGPGPTPREVFDEMWLTVAGTVFLLSSSVTIHFAIAELQKGRLSQFRVWWFATILLGALFLLGTAKEWHGLIYRHNLTIATNLFGSTYYTLVGFHAFHVTLGLVLLSLVFALALAGKVSEHRAENVDLISWYWHFVDVVWIVVFTVVYIIGR